MTDSQEITIKSAVKSVLFDKKEWDKQKGWAPKMLFIANYVAGVCYKAVVPGMEAVVETYAPETPETPETPEN